MDSGGTHSGPLGTVIPGAAAREEGRGWGDRVILQPMCDEQPRVFGDAPARPDRRQALSTQEVNGAERGFLLSQYVWHS